MSAPCDCRNPAGTGGSASRAIPPGQSSFSYRAGTYGSFFAAMKQRLSSAQFAALTGLKTRESDDPAIALCDAWAVVADVLTFYQERIANEGYLRTATDRSSIIEMGRLAGYTLRPGVSANVYLAYTMGQGSRATVDVGHRVQSVPPPGGLPQTFETAEPVDARDAWNTLPPRLTRPQLIAPEAPVVYADGISTNLKKNDPVLLLANGTPNVRRVAEVTVQSPDNRTLLSLQPLPTSQAAVPVAAAPVATGSFDRLVELVAPLSQPPAAHPLNALRLRRRVGDTFMPASDTTPSLLTTLSPAIGLEIYRALGNAQVTTDPAGEVHALRVQAAPFGHNAPMKPIFDEKGVVIGTEEWPLGESIAIRIVIDTATPDPGVGVHELRVGSLRFSATRRVPELGITVEMGPVKASAAVALPDQAEAIQLGPWSVEVTPNLDWSPPSIDFSFGTPITRDIRIAFRNSGESIEVIIDRGASSIVVAHGQSTSTSDNGAQTLVSFIHSVLVVDERALAPDASIIQLDAAYDKIIRGSWVVIERPESKVPRVTQVVDARLTSVARYGLNGRVTELTLKDAWLDPKTDLTLASVRSAVVSAQSEKLTLAEEPIQTDVAGNRVELSSLYGGLQSGRWLIVQGERTDISSTSGVSGSELVMLASVEQDVTTLDGTMPLHASILATAASGLSGSKAAGPAGVNAPLLGRPGDKTHSFLRLADGLAHTYKRDTVKVYGNVTRATHGETRVETLGSGDASVAGQRFILHIAPLTYVSASTPQGVQSTLVVTVNDVPWTEVTSLAGAGPRARVYVTSTNDTGTTMVAFGDGVHGARLPTGVANVKAQYRSGIGQGGNVGAGEINLLVARPAGVKTIVNPLPASGGADSESRDEARRNVPIGVIALDRLVSVADYVALARTFAGIAKASATQLRTGGKSLIGLTVAASGDAEIADGSDLIVNLSAALRQAGDARQGFAIRQRELVLLVASVSLTLADGYLWEAVAVPVRAALLTAFGFDQRELAQSVALSEFLQVVQRVPGVAAAAVTQFDGIGRADVETPASFRAKLSQIASATFAKQTVTALPARIEPVTGNFLPAQLVILSPHIVDTLILLPA